MFKQFFLENIINYDNIYKKKDKTMSQSNSSYFIAVLVQKYKPWQGMVWSQYRLPGKVYVPLVF